MTLSEYNRTVAKAFDEAAVGYDRPATRFFVRSAQALARVLPRRDVSLLLDVATGTGNIALALADRFPRAKVVGVDMSEGMLARARTKASGRRASRLFFEQTEAEGLAYPGGFFDGATCGFGVHFWPDMAAGVRRVLTQIRSGGVFALSAFAQGSFEPQAGVSLSLFGEMGVQMPKTYTLEKLDQPHKIKGLLKEVGLKNIRVVQKSVGYPLKNFQEWWDLILFTGYRAFLGKLSSADQSIYKKRLKDRMAALPPAQGKNLRVNVLLGVGIKP